MNRRLLLSLVLLGLWPFILLAKLVDAQVASAPIVRDIEIQGNRRTQESTIRFYVQTEIGKPLVPAVVNDDVKRLYALRAFENIRVTAVEVPDGIKLIFAVSEKPAIRMIEFTGNRAINTDEISKRVLIKERETLDRNRLNDTITGIQQHYREEGYYFAHITPEVTPIDDNQVNVALRITEGRKIRINRINFTGNKHFSDATLRKEVQLRQPPLPFLGGPASLYKPEALRVDLQLLEQFYQNNGFVNVQLGEPIIEINREAGAIAITIPVAREGEQYKIGKVTLTGDDVFSAEEIRQKVRVASGEIFSREVLRGDILNLTEAYNDRGYAFADVAPTLNFDEQRRLVNLGFTARPGPRVYIGRIDIIGNERTRDAVIRRELRIDEGELYSGSKLRRSRQRLTNLQYFEEVKIDTKRRQDSDLLDLGVEVSERSTGQFTAGLGFSSVETVVFTASVTQANLFGRGQTLSAMARLGRISQDFSISFQEPWLYGRPISLSASIFRRSEDFLTFDVDRTGFSVGLGRIVGEFLRGSLNYNFEVLDISNLDPSASEFLREQEGMSITSSVTPRLSWDSRNNPVDPSQGSVNSIEVEAAGLGGTNRFYKVIGTSTWYFSLPAELSGFVRGRFGFGDGYGGERLPPSERFFLGGVTTVRGFQFRDLGPQDREDNPLGGTSFLQFNLEVGRSLGRLVRIVSFIDVGNVYNTDNQFDISDLRRSAGLGVRVVTPIGPIRLDYGFKLDRRPGESIGELGFLLGTF